MNKTVKFIATACFSVLLSSGFAQLQTPQPSPTATISQKVGLSDVKITYSRPGMKDREIFGNLVPYGEIWRTGANKATEISISDDVKIGGKDVPAGAYSLFTIPGENEWTIILNKNTELWGAGNYKQEDDAARFTVKPTKLSEPVESFTIDFGHFSGSDAHLMLMWENTKVSIPIKTNTNAMVEKQIKEILIDGPSAASYAGAAIFYLENDKDLNQALDWMNKALEKRPDAFWYIHQQAKILGKLGKKKEAIAAAEKSMEMAKNNPGGDFGYVANNEKLIKELKGK